VLDGSCAAGCVLRGCIWCSGRAAGASAGVGLVVEPWSRPGPRRRVALRPALCWGAMATPTRAGRKVFGGRLPVEPGCRGALVVIALNGCPIRLEDGHALREVAECRQAQRDPIARQVPPPMKVRIRWTVQQGYDDGKDATGESQDGVHNLTARTPGGQYEAMLGRQDGERIKMGTFADAYWACVDHNWSMQTPEVQATRHGTVNRTPQPHPRRCAPSALPSTPGSASKGCLLCSLSPQVFGLRIAGIGKDVRSYEMSCRRTWPLSPVGISLSTSHCHARSVTTPASSASLNSSTVLPNAYCVLTDDREHLMLRIEHAKAHLILADEI
jgi:hypothetical protein